MGMSLYACIRASAESRSVLIVERKYVLQALGIVLISYYHWFDIGETKVISHL